MMAEQRRRWVSFAAIFCAGCAATLLLSILIRPAEPHREINALNLPLISDCVSSSSILTGDGKPTVALFTEVQSMCYDRIYGQGLLNDFQLRRLAFVEQAYSQKVVLWMVVVITLSGVLLAGLQVLASYKLAAAGRGEIGTSELNLARDKLSLKSSIAGLFILIISFAFFYVFVFEIYKIHPIDIDSKNSKQTTYVGQIDPSTPVPLPDGKK
jgi:hypothetical protein